MHFPAAIPTALHRAAQGTACATGLKTEQPSAPMWPAHLHQTLQAGFSGLSLNGFLSAHSGGLGFVIWAIPTSKGQSRHPRGPCMRACSWGKMGVRATLQACESFLRL